MNVAHSTRAFGVARQTAGGGLAALAALALLAPLTASAQSGISAERGRGLAERLCANCHLAGETALRNPVPAGVPTLSAIANSPGQTGQRIFNALIVPHPPMPDTKLTVDEIWSIVAYLDELRRDKSVPPLLPPDPKPVKPDMPRAG